MPDDAPQDRLRLPELSIKDFRGLNDLTIPKLGRVTLIVGKNGVGKTTVLDAIRIYAAHGDHSTLLQVLQDREEVSFRTDENGDDFFAPDWEALFFGRNASDKSCILIGPNEEKRKLRIRIGFPEEQAQQELPNLLRNSKIRVMKVEIAGEKREFPLVYSAKDFAMPRAFIGRTVFRNETKHSSYTTCRLLGPEPLENRDLAQLWSSVALTDSEDHVIESLRLILGQDIERIAVLGDAAPSRKRASQRIMIKSADYAERMPLKSLGDGTIRMFSIALSLVCSRDGFLLIDEVENGIHHAAEYEFWRMVLTTAKQNNVQVFATTHGWDCVVGFAQAAKEIGDSEGALIRLDEKNGGARTIHYSTSDLETAASLGIEVR